MLFPTPYPSPTYFGIQTKIQGSPQDYSADSLGDKKPWPDSIPVPMHRFPSWWFVSARSGAQHQPGNLAGLSGAGRGSP